MGAENGACLFIVKSIRRTQTYFFLVLAEEENMVKVIAARRNQKSVLGRKQL